MPLPTNFNPNPSTIPTQCLTTPSAACDTQVGSLAMGSGICFTSPDIMLCACVNSATTCPELTNPYCGNNPFAYRPTYADDCSDVKMCVNSTLLGGSYNVVGNTLQTCTDAEITNVSISLTYMLFLVIFIVITVLIVVRLMNKKQSSDSS